jgi:hypothetical protein
MVILSIVLALLGLVATIVGLYVTYITYINPEIRLSWYLKDIDGWEEVNFDFSDKKSFWRYKKHPEFTIIQQENGIDWDSDADEPWMIYPFPDPNKKTYEIYIKSNRTLILKEVFITLDGSRYFVPLPRVAYGETIDENRYYYTRWQIKISKVIGRYYRMKSVEEFARENNIKIINE